MQGPEKLKVRPETVLGVHPEVLKAFGEVIDRIVTDLDEITECMNVCALYFERKGIKEELFTEDEVQGTEKPTDTIPGVPDNDKQF